MNDTPSIDAERRSTHARALVIGAIIPLAIVTVSTVLMVSWLPELPDPIAVHWNPNGVDGFGPALPFVVVPAVVTAIFSGFAVAWSWKTTPSGRISWSQKFLLVTSMWLSSMLSIGFGASLAIQRGIPDAHDAPNVGPWLLVAAGIGLVLSVVGWFLLPASENVEAPGEESTPLEVSGEERVSWSKSMRLGTSALLVVGVAILIGLATVVVATLASPESTVLGVIVVTLVAVLAITNFWWRVSADRRGFIAKGFFGVPRKRIRLDDIRQVKVVDVNPTQEFGGWGWRWASGGRSGIVLRSGKGIEVTQANGKRFVVTVDDAATGAGVLAALVAQRSR